MILGSRHLVGPGLDQCLDLYPEAVDHQGAGLEARSVLPCLAGNTDG